MKAKQAQREKRTENFTSRQNSNAKFGGKILEIFSFEIVYFYIWNVNEWNTWQFIIAYYCQSYPY